MNKNLFRWSVFWCEWQRVCARENDKRVKVIRDIFTVMFVAH